MNKEDKRISKLEEFIWFHDSMEDLDKRISKIEQIDEKYLSPAI